VDLYYVLRFKKRWTSLTDYVDFCSVLHGLQIAEYSGSPYFDFECRVVRFKISDDTYESIITNLDESEFNIQDIEELYHLR